jgi:hypothetical protein
MNPVTPLRRSERLRRPTNKAFGSSPGSSPGTAANVGRSSSSRSRVFSTPGGQTGSDSTLRNTTPSESSGSYMEDANSDSTVSMAMAARFPKELHRAYLGLDRILSYTDDDLMMHVSLLPFPTTNSPSFVPTLTPTMCHTGHLRFKWLYQRHNRIAPGCHGPRMLRPMAPLQLFRENLLAD